MSLNEILGWPSIETSPESIISESQRMKRELEEDLLQNPWNIENLDTETLKRYIQVEEDGSLSLFNQPLTYWILHFTMPTLFSEKISEEIEVNYKKKNLLWNILEIWIEQASKVQQGILLKSIRDDDNIIEAQISTVISLYRNLEQQFFMLNTEDFNKKVQEIFAAMYIAENEEEIIGYNDMQKVESAFFSQSQESNAIFLQTMNAMRYGGWSGNSKWVQNAIEQQLLQTEDFQDVRDIISQIPEFIDLLESNDFSSLNNILGRDIAAQLISQYGKIKNTISKRIQSQSEGKTQEEIQNALTLGVHESLSLLLWKTLTYKKISHMQYRGDSEHSLTWMYADIVWLWENNGFLNDIFNVSDENIDWIIEWWVTLAIGVLTLGAWTVAMVWARALISWVWLSSRLARSGKIMSFIWWSALDGLSFYEGATLASNLLYRENFREVLDETGNIQEIWKSMLFMGMLNGVMRGASLLRRKPFIQNIESKVWSSLSPQISQVILYGSWLGLSTGAIMGISGTIEELFWQWWEPSWREYFHLLALLGVFHRIQNIWPQKENIPIRFPMRENLIPA